MRRFVGFVVMWENGYICGEIRGEGSIKTAYQ